MWRLAAAGCFVLGCSVDALDLTGKRCPCVDGYVCDVSRGICVYAGPGNGEGGAGPDSFTSEAALADSRTPGDGAVPNDGPPASCDAALATDPNNCGACAHDCLGGSCEAGSCQPILLASTGSQVSGMALDTANVYWTQVPYVDGGPAVSSCAKSGCNKTPNTLWSGQGVPAGIATDGTNVYWTDSSTGAVRQCGSAGCTGAATTLATGQPTPYTIVVNGSNVVWLNQGATLGAGSVAVCRIGGCGGAPSLLATNQYVPIGPAGLATDGALVYWTTADLLSCAATGCSQMPTTLTSLASGAEVVGLSLQGGSFYWADNDRYQGAGQPSGTIAGCPMPGCSGGPSVLVQHVDPVAMAVDGTGAYWLDGFSGSLERCSLTGCTNPTVMATAYATWLLLPYGLALDSVAVYWADAAGDVYKLAK